MSVLIKGMEMPKCCNACSFACWSNLHQTGSCYLLDSEQCFDDYSTDYRTKRSEHCPLTEVPEPHGRLIDADALTDCLATLLQFPSNLVNGQWIVNTIREQPTIITAEDGE